VLDENVRIFNSLF